MRKLYLSSLAMSLAALSSAPLFVSAAGLVPDCQADGCTWSDFIDLIQNIFNFLVFTIMPVATVLGFAYAGFLWMTSGGDTKMIGKAKTIFKNILLSYVIILSAVMVVKLIFEVMFGNNIEPLIK